MDHIASPYGYFFLIGALVGVTPIYIYNTWGEEYLCGELFFGTFAGVIPCWVL